MTPGQRSMTARDLQCFVYQPSSLDFLDVTTTDRALIDTLFVLSDDVAQAITFSIGPKAGPGRPQVAPIQLGASCRPGYCP